MAITNCWLTAKLIDSGATAVDFSHVHNLAIEGTTGFSVTPLVAKTVLIADDSASVRLLRQTQNNHPIGAALASGSA
jgi:hypothetical protein